MSQPETVLSNAIRLALGKAARHVRLFRSHSGTFWAGRCVSYEDGVAVLANAQRIQGGLTEGAGDLVGYVSVIVTPDMVGKRVAIFAAPDIKTPTAKSPPPAQITWRDNVLAAGGIAGFIRSPEEALTLIASAPGRPA